jgi:hypothetical protein
MSSGLETRPGATTLGLDDLVELAWSGHIRVAHFQRDFCWTSQDVIHRYPVSLRRMTWSLLRTTSVSGRRSA